MPLNSYTVGRDFSMVIVGPAGPIVFKDIISFKSKPNTTDQKIKGLDGITRHLRFPDGWDGVLGLERQDNVLDDYWAQIEANYYAGLNESPIIINETITEVNGSVSQYRYLQVLLTPDDMGTYEGDKSVKQSIKFVAARRVKVS